MELERLNAVSVGAASQETTDALHKSVSLNHALTLINRMVSQRGARKGRAHESDVNSDLVQHAVIPLVPRGFAKPPVVLDQAEPVLARTAMPVFHRRATVKADAQAAETPKTEAPKVDAPETEAPKNETAETTTAEERISAFMWAAAERAVAERAAQTDLWPAELALAASETRAKVQPRVDAAAKTIEPVEPARLLEWIRPENSTEPVAVAKKAEESVLVTFPAPRSVPNSSKSQRSLDESRVKRFAKWLLCWGWDDEDDDVEPDTQYGATFTSEPVLVRPLPANRKTS